MQQPEDPRPFPDLYELARRLATFRDAEFYPKAEDAIAALHEDPYNESPQIGWIAILPGTTRDDAKYSHQVWFQQDSATILHMKNMEDTWADDPYNYDDPHWPLKLAVKLRDHGLEVADDWNKE